jgi:hypothetical protein
VPIPRATGLLSPSTRAIEGLLSVKPKEQGHQEEIGQREARISFRSEIQNSKFETSTNGPMFKIQNEPTGRCRLSVICALDFEFVSDCPNDTGQQEVVVL